jgi:predicted transcriptional regulator
MTKRASITLRLSPDLKAAAERAAKDDDRSVSWIAEQALAEWLRACGYLDAPAGPTRVRRSPTGR